MFQKYKANVMVEADYYCVKGRQGQWATVPNSSTMNHAH